MEVTQPSDSSAAESEAAPFSRGHQGQAGGGAIPRRS